MTAPQSISPVTCDVCRGEGRVAYIQSAGGFSEPADCYKCGGTGDTRFDAIMGAVRSHTHDHTSAYAITKSVLAALRASLQPATPTSCPYKGPFGCKCEPGECKYRAGGDAVAGEAKAIGWISEAGLHTLQNDNDATICCDNSPGGFNIPVFLRSTSEAAGVQDPAAWQEPNSPERIADQIIGKIWSKKYTDFRTAEKISIAEYEIIKAINEERSRSVAQPSVNLHWLVDWVHLYATEGNSWISKISADKLITLAARQPTQADANRLTTEPLASMVSSTHPRPLCSKCGLEDGACICAHLAHSSPPRDTRPDWKQDKDETSLLPRGAGK